MILLVDHPFSFRLLSCTDDLNNLHILYIPPEHDCNVLNRFCIQKRNQKRKIAKNAKNTYI